MKVEKERLLGNHFDSCATLASDEDRAWQLAQDRVLLYLKTLGVPARLSLELALEVFRRSEHEQQTAGGFAPTQTAMRALRVLLAERQPPCSEPYASLRLQRTFPVSPLLNRGSMTAAAMESSLWRALLGWAVKPFRRAPVQQADAAQSPNVNPQC
jgi:hypothetical protein